MATWTVSTLQGLEFDLGGADGETLEVREGQ